MLLFGLLVLLYCLSHIVRTQSPIRPALSEKSLRKGLKHQVGSAVIWGPKEVYGYIGGSLTMTCYYDAGYETLRKQWCRGLPWTSCKMLVETTGTEQVVKKDRVTLRDNQSQRRFNVTMDRLRLNDTDTYWCRIARSGLHKVELKVTVFSAPTNTTTTTTATITTAPTSTVPPEETTNSLNVTDHPSSTTSIPASVFLRIIPALLSLPLLLAALLVWRKLKRQRTAARVSPNLDAQEEGLVCYAQLTLHPCIFEPTYATVTSQESPSASRSPEVASEYSSIRRPTAEL